MEKTHWKSLINNKYLGAHLLPEGKDIIVTIKAVVQEQVTGSGGIKTDEIVAYLYGTAPFILNKTNMEIIESVLESPYIEDWIGKCIQIYYDPKVKFGKETVGGLRVRNHKPLWICWECASEIVGAYGHGPDWIGKYTRQKYKMQLCHKCAEKRSKNEQSNTDGQTNS